LAQLNKPATSLMLEKGNPIILDEILEKIRSQFNQSLQTFLTEGFHPFVLQFKKFNSSWIGEKITFHIGEDILEGIVHSIEDNGSLNLILSNGTIKNFTTGEIALE
jgi:biotin-(acetyl-CoA carboxylase) ligase